MKKTLFLAFLLPALAVLSCRTVYVPVNSSSDSAAVNVTTRTDSVRFEVRDSIFVKEGGDTVFIERFKTVFKEKIKTVTDTVSLTVVQTKEVPVEVEKKLTLWQSLKLRAFWWIAAVAAASVLYLFFKGKLFKTIKKWLIPA